MPEFLFYLVAIPLGFAALGFAADRILPCITKRLEEWSGEK